MKIEVIANFLDSKNNLAFVKAGTVLTVPAERGKELIEKGFAREIKETKKKK